MSRLGTELLKRVVARRVATSHVRAPADDWAAYVRWQYESTGPLLRKFPPLELDGKSVLEIGCGTGGRSAYLAEHGAARVVGIDINLREIAVARAQCRRLFPRAMDRLEFYEAYEDKPLPLGQFDVVLLLDTIEHVVSPPKMMRLAHAYTAPGGRFFFSSIGWYHFAGSHMGIMPFVNVFFSDATILDVMRWRVSQPGYQPTRFDSQPPIERWRGLYDLRDRPGEYLNKLTLKQMKQLAASSVFGKGKVHVVGFGHRRPLFRLTDPLRHVPGIQEMYHSIVIGEFEK
jgi:2-polyprenyl-3-methyl-5-hydroxy-6-metoxy-1,4-benzoquinol methylase